MTDSETLRRIAADLQRTQTRLCISLRAIGVDHTNAIRELEAIAAKLEVEEAREALEAKQAEWATDADPERAQAPPVADPG